MRAVQKSLTLPDGTVPQAVITVEASNQYLRTFVIAIELANMEQAGCHIEMRKLHGCLETVVPLLLLQLVNGCGGSSSMPAPSPAPAQVIATVGVGVDPVSVAVNSATNRIYVANRGDGITPGSVMVIDGTTNSVDATVPVGLGPCGIAANSLTNKIYVTNSYEDSLTVIDRATNQTQLIFFDTGSFPCELAVNTATNKIYVVNGGRNVVAVVDGASNSATRIPVAKLPEHIAINPVTNKIYVGNSISASRGSGANLTVIDGATNQTSVVALDSAAYPTLDVAVNPLTDKVYVGGGGIVTIFDGTTLASSTITAGDGLALLALNASTNKIYVVNNSTDSLTIIDGATLNALTVPTGQYPAFITVDEAKNQIYVVNRDSATVTVIDGASNATGTLPVDVSPIREALNPTTHRVYVANACGKNPKCGDNGTLTVIDGPH